MYLCKKHKYTIYMKQICSILLFFLISAGSYAQNFADYFQNKTLRVIISSPETISSKRSIWTSYLSFPPGQVVNIICPNFHSKAMGRSASEISPRDNVSTRLPFLLCFRSGCPPMKPRRQPKGSKIHSCFPTPNSRQR